MSKSRPIARATNLPFSRTRTLRAARSIRREGLHGYDFDNVVRILLRMGCCLAASPRTGAGAGTGSVSCIVNKDFDVRVICSGLSPSNNNYPYTITFTVPGSCPTNYVRVAKNFAVGTYHDFCVAKYEMGNDGSGNAISSQTANPWTSIIRGNGGGDGGAIDQCQKLGTGYDLITNAQWQTIARDIENAYSGGSYLNWSNGANTGSNYLNMGNMGADGNYYYNTSTDSGIAADVDTNPCSGITAHPNCATNTSSDWAYKRTHQLSNGNIIWDMGANDWTWVKDNNTTTQGSNNYASQAPWTSGLQAMWGPAGTYTAMNSETMEV